MKVQYLSVRRVRPDDDGVITRIYWQKTKTYMTCVAVVKRMMRVVATTRVSTQGQQTAALVHVFMCTLVGMFNFNVTHKQR